MGHSNILLTTPRSQDVLAELIDPAIEKCDGAGEVRLAACICYC